MGFKFRNKTTSLSAEIYKREYLKAKLAAQREYARKKARADVKRKYTGGGGFFSGINTSGLMSVATTYDPIMGSKPRRKKR